MLILDFLALVVDIAAFMAFMAILAVILGHHVSKIICALETVMLGVTDSTCGDLGDLHFKSNCF